MNNLTDRTPIIRAIRTPLGFYSLMVLVVEVILGGLALRATGTDFALLLAGMLVILVLLILSVAFTANVAARGVDAAGKRASRSSAKKYDAFLSSVLGGFGDETRLVQERDIALKIAKCMEQDCGFTVYYRLPYAAGRMRESVGSLLNLSFVSCSTSSP